MNFLLIAIPTIYTHGFQQVAKWNSCGVDYIHLEQECELLAMVDNIEGKLQHDFLEWNRNAFIVNHTNV